MTVPVPLPRAARLGLLTMAASRSALAASLAWLCTLGVVYASDPGPPMAAMAVTTAALFPIAAWAASAHLAVTSGELRALLVAADGWARTTVADAVAPLLWTAAAAVLGVGTCLAADPRPMSAGQVLAGLVLHLLAGTSGVALALTAHSRALTRAATALLVVSAAVASVLIPVLPPAGPILRAWLDPNRKATPGREAWAVVGSLLLIAALSAIAARSRRTRL